jgi:hypothetical protein
MPADPLTKLLQDVEDYLVQNLPIAIKKRSFKIPSYGLILIYTGTDSDMSGASPPFLVPSVKFREEIEQTETRINWPYMLWTAAEIRGRDGVLEAWCDDKNLTRNLEKIYDLTIGADIGYEPVKNMFQRVCRGLNQVDWPSILPVTDDFIVITSDSHSEMTETPDEYIPAAKLELLRQRGRMSK